MNYFEFNEYTNDYEFDKTRISLVREILFPIYLDIKLYIQNTYIWLTFEKIFNIFLKKLNIFLEKLNSIFFFFC
jgi:hypothetical protein